MGASEDRIELALKISGRMAVNARDEFLYFLDTLRVNCKEDDSPVTPMDLEIERTIRREIESVFPDDTIVGEEFPDHKGLSEYRWLIDPIDGTKSFIHGVPLFSTLIGLEKSGESICGIISLPALGLILYAEKGGGAWLRKKGSNREERVNCSSCRNISDAVFLTSEVLTFNKAGRRDAYERLERSVKFTRTWGDAYGYFLVATGKAEMMVDPILSDWDAGPLLVILEEAGGKFTDWKGNRTIYGKEGIGSNGILHDEILKILNEK
ncbi:MAG: histidinol phosphate phosphatase [Planctomycetaceae bacterium]|jgi:histidinol phosphatase-like enzyme (inositol monophosphatase family)|nr:histidinol phosphate phosphatase [Planctomycetaceae bacterium]